MLANDMKDIKKRNTAERLKVEFTAFNAVNADVEKLSECVHNLLSAKKLLDK